MRNNFTRSKPNRFGSVVEYPDLGEEVLGSSPGHTKNFKMVLTTPQSVLVKISLSKGNAPYTLYNGPPDKGGIIQRVGCLTR